MKILFISLHNPNSIGVNKKVLQQVSFFEKSGFEIKALLINPNYKETKTEGVIQFIKMDKIPKISPIFKRRYFRNFQDYVFQNAFNNLLFDELEKYVKKETFEAIYYRYTFANFPLVKFAKRYKNKLILEHNTKEIDELKLGILKDSGLRYNLLIEKHFVKSLFRNSLFGVAVTNEIKNYENERAGFTYCNFIYKNPIKIENFTPRQINQNKKYTLSILIGSYDEWHGLDLLCDAIIKNKKVNFYKLIYIGNKTEEVERICKGIDVEFVGKQDQHGVKKYLTESDITVGSLAPQRVNIYELSSLKSREYMAMGIPFIIGCPDTAFEGKDEEIMKYVRVMDFVNDPNALKEVEDFVTFVRSKSAAREVPW